MLGVVMIMSDDIVGFNTSIYMCNYDDYHYGAAKI